MSQMQIMPALALSVRQPWAWAIIHGGKDIENRTWQAVNHGLKQRGRVAIHASKGMTRDEYEEASEFINDRLSYWQGSSLRCPAPADLLRGGIIGTVEVTDVVNESKSPWFFGPRGLVLCNAEACTFIPAVGALGYFKWTQADASIVPPAARWMLPEVEPRDRRHEQQVAASEPDLFAAVKTGERA